MISEFITQVKTRGLARNNRFRVTMPIPGNTNQIVQVANLFCDSLQLPSSTIGTTPHRTYGEMREMPYEKMYEPINMSFYIDSGMEVKRTFEEWVERIFNTQTRQFGFYNEYVTTAQIFVQTVDGAEPYVVTLHEAYPKVIGAIPLDGASKDVAKMNLTLQYKYWTSQTLQSLVTSVISKFPMQSNQPATTHSPSNTPADIRTTIASQTNQIGFNLTDVLARGSADRFAGFSADILAGLTADMLTGVSADRLARVSADVLARLSTDMLAGYPASSVDFGRPSVDPQFPTVVISGRDPYTTGAPTGYPDNVSSSAVSYINSFFV